METNTIQTNAETEKALVISPEQLFIHWQGHRDLTRRVIEAFPEDKLYKHTIGGMRCFADLAMEIIGMAVPGVKGVITGDWSKADVASVPAPPTKKELLALWDNTTEQIKVLWPQIPPHRFQEVDVAFGLYKAPLYYIILYWIDNEIHHRAQGYVYLRSLGIEPPPFYDRPF